MAQNSHDDTSWQPLAGADFDRRWLLGDLLKRRRAALGYAYRPRFLQDRNINQRMSSDIENAHRDTFTYPALQNIARAYGVTYDSIIAVARGTADELAPAAGAEEPPAAAPRLLPAAPMDDAGRTAADRPYADRIWADLRAWAAKGITDPTGAQLFGAGTPDAQAWDGTAGRMPEGDRVWHIADLQRFGDRNPNDRSAAGA